MGKTAEVMAVAAVVAPVGPTRSARRLVPATASQYAMGKPAVVMAVAAVAALAVPTRSAWFPAPAVVSINLLMGYAAQKERWWPPGAVAGQIAPTRTVAATAAQGIVGNATVSKCVGVADVSKGYLTSITTRC